ncbi:MAG: hypothetical protein FD129_2488, partial [bacterium]
MKSGLASGSVYGPPVATAVLFVLLPLTLMSLCRASADRDEGGRSLVILSSASMFGRIPYDVPPLHKDNLGGVGRLAKFFQRTRDENPHVL